MISSDTDRLWAIVDQDGVNLGNAGIHKIYWPARNGRLGIVIGRTSSQGRGLGQEALKLLIAKAFMDLGLHKVWVVHYGTNERMRHILKKLSFSQEGVLRDEYFHSESFHDMVRQSLLEDEFDQLKGSWNMG